MESGLVTTIIPVFNRAAMLREAVASVLAQTYRPIEIIVIDDGSSDQTLDVARELAASHSEISVLSQANGGAGIAREAGRAAARGEFIQYLDSDDLLLPEKFELQVHGLRESPQCDVSYGWTRLRKRNGQVEPEPWKRTGERIETIFPAMLQSRWWETSTPLYRSALLEKAGPWKPLRVEEDWEYDTRVASLGVRLQHCPSWISETREHDGGQLSQMGLTPSFLRDRAAAHAMILENALGAGIGAEVPEMRHFARELFLLARQCGAAGLGSESMMLLGLARSASASDPLDIRIYRAVASAIGATTAGRLSSLMDRLRA